MRPIPGSIRHTSARPSNKFSPCDMCCKNFGNKWSWIWLRDWNNSGKWFTEHVRWTEWMAHFRQNVPAVYISDREPYSRDVWVVSVIRMNYCGFCLYSTFFRRFQRTQIFGNSNIWTFYEKVVNFQNFVSE